jgi:hypothetical protein
MESKHDWLISREVLNEGSLVQAMGMEEGRVQRHEVDDIDHAYLQLREVVAQPPGGGHRLLRRNVTRTDQHDVRFDTLIVARPAPGR